MKYGKNLRKKNTELEFNGDGRFKKERIKGYWKKHLRKWYLRYLAQQTKEQ